MKEGNGDNRFWIELKSDNDISDDEWLSLLIQVNKLLKTSNIGAYLCEDD